VQFATNTPDAPAVTATPATESDDMQQTGGFPTNTPLAEPDTPTPAASATPIATRVPAQSTPIPLPTFFIPQESDRDRIAGTAVPDRAQVIPRDYELVNIVLMGTDNEIVQDNTIRTDTMIIASINTETGSVSLLRLPRDLFVYIPTPTMTRLNTVYGIGESFGWDGGGFGLLRQTIFYNFGIQVHYYALVDISGLREIIDTLGGVNIAVDCAYRDYALVGAEVPDEAELTDPEALEYTLPVGYYHFDGAEALWYARTRGNSDDFDRGRRQQELLRAIFRAGLESGQINQVPALWNEITQVVETDISLDVVLGLLPIALNLEPGQIETFGLIRTYHTTPWQPPSGAFAGQFVQLPNADPIRQLLLDFYQPPTTSQIELSGPQIAVYNGTTNPDWDIVASETLRNAGLNAYAAGMADSTDYSDNVLIDYVGDEKGSPVPQVLDTLNMSVNQVEFSPQADRDVDYQVIVGANYDSCRGSVIDVE
jgi:LCP family protein required for cell wall assembly